MFYFFVKQIYFIRISYLDGQTAGQEGFLLKLWRNILVELATHGGLAEENSLLNVRFLSKNIYLISIFLVGQCFQKVKKIFYFKTNIYVASGSTYISSITETL